MLHRFVDKIIVLSPRPFIPSSLALRPRWQFYASIPYHYVSRGIEVYRPAYLVMPGVMQSFWLNAVAYYAARPVVKELHRKHRFDAILSFDLCAAGGLAWRLARDLGIPAAGWAVGDDIRNPENSSFGRAASEALQKLDLVFYQSSELLYVGAQILGTKAEHLQRSGRHRILSRGIIGSETPLNDRQRAAVRASLRVADGEVVILYLGRITYDKGLFGLVDIFARNSGQIGNMRLVLIGSQPAFDDTADLIRHLEQYPAILERVHILPACSPEEVWTYFNAADILAFPSLKEGMPNSLLEGMLSGLPSVTFDIPAIRDILRYDREALFSIPDFNYGEFFERLVLLSKDQHLRKATGLRAKHLVQQHFSLRHNMRSAITSLKAVESYRESQRGYLDVV